MKSLRIEPSCLKGYVKIPPSKSICHRVLICAGLAEGISEIENVVLSEDIAATLDGVKAMGAVIKTVENETDSEEGEPCRISVQGSPELNLLSGQIDCRESGSTLRFLIPLAIRSGQQVRFVGRGKLGERPLQAYYRIFEEQGIEYYTEQGHLPLMVKGSLKPGTYNIEGNVSSQFISGLMFLLPLLEADSKIIMTTELESRGYVDLTIDTLSKFGIEVHNNAYREFCIKGNQIYKNTRYRIEGDYSQAAFWIVAAILGLTEIECQDLNPGSLQGDGAILKIVRDMGVSLEVRDSILKVKPAVTKGIVIDAGQCPDLVPVLAVLASLSQGTTTIVNAGRLRIKESDRLKAISTELKKLGANIQERKEGLIITGVNGLKGGVVDSWNDHRIAMALAVASVRCDGPVYLTGFEAVNKSYPHFWTDFLKLGGNIL